MNDTQQKELLTAIVDLRKKVAELEKRQTETNKRITILESKTEATIKALSKVVASIKQISSRVIHVKERLSSTESAVRQSVKK